MNHYERDGLPPLAVEVAMGSDATLLASISGEVDLATASHLTTRLIDAIDSHSPRHLVIDAAAMPFLDAAGISAFVAVYRHAADSNIDVRLINVRPLVSTVIHIVELADFFQVTAAILTPGQARPARGERRNKPRRR